MRIGIVTGGGDCPGLNAVIRAVAKTATKRGWETLGIIGGYEGLLSPQNYRVLDYKALDGLLVRGGTILGTANRGRFSAKTGHGETRQLPKELIDETKCGLEQLGITALVAVGGDGSLTIAQQMHEQGVPIVGVPKTIDNDLAATTTTFGFDGGKPQSCARAGGDGTLRRLDRNLRGRRRRRGRDFDSGNSFSLREHLLGGGGA
jgi:6-phosphofructokinase 1